MESYIGQLVLIRDDMAGVLVGTCEAVDIAAGTWTLSAARKVHYWARSAAVEGLAVTGDRGEGGRVTPVVARTSGRALVQIILDDGGCRRLLEAPAWTP